jgi:glycosyltransferase involved in cell wall biosynthesis
MRFFVYRNCFTGDVSGGDMHTGGFCAWVHNNRPESPLTLVHAAGDGQEQAYAETAMLPRVQYAGTAIRQPVPLMFLLRAVQGAKVLLPGHAREEAALVAGSHFLPDVWPVYRKGNPGDIRAVFIHHIVQDMPRPKNLNTLLANVQERISFWLIRRRFDRIITVNHAVVEGLRRRGFKQPILVSSNFVDNGGARAVPYADKDLTLVFCGRMVRQKGVDAFVHLCEQLQDELPDFRAVMIGVGPELPRLVALATRKRLAITFAGRASDADKFEYLRRAQLFVLPSIEEGWGIVVAEALSVGTPVLAYDLPVYGPVFGVHINTVAIGNEQRLRASARRLLAQYRRSPEAYDKGQAELVAFARAFAVEEVATREYTFITEGAQ